MEENREALDAQHEFADQRASGIGATDTPKILGLSKYGTALSVYEDKANPTGKDPSSLFAWLGLQLQNTVAELYTTATGNRVRAATKHYRHRTHDWLVCHLDYKVWGDPDTLVECKTRAYMKGRGEDGTVDIPPDVWAQVQHEMLVTGATECHVSVLFGHHTFRVYPIPRDEEFLKHLVPTLMDFWFLSVKGLNPPAASASPVDAALLTAKDPKDNGTIATATARQASLVKELLRLVEIEETTHANVVAQQNVIKAALGAHQGFYTPYGTVTWANTKDRHEWGPAFGKLTGLLMSNTEDPELDAAVASIITEHTKPGTRRFSFSKYEGDK